MKNLFHNFEGLWILSKLVSTELKTDLSIESYNKKTLSGSTLRIASCTKTDFFCMKSHKLEKSRKELLNSSCHLTQEWDKLKSI